MLFRSSLAPSYLNVAKASLQHLVSEQKNKENTQVKHDHFNTRKKNNKNINQQVNINKRFHDRRNFFFNGKCFSCHNFGHKAAQCVAKTIMTREARKKRNETGIKKNTYNNFYPHKNEIECSYCNKFGHEECKCRRKLQPKENIP